MEVFYNSPISNVIHPIENLEELYVRYGASIITNGTSIQLKTPFSNIVLE